MAYFAPYLDETGLNLPTYEDRLEALCADYRQIFGQASELTEALIRLLEDLLHQLNAAEEGRSEPSGGEIG